MTDEPTQPEQGADGEPKARLEALVKRCAELEKENEDLCFRLRRWQQGGNALGTNYQVKTLKAERDRLWVLATKHCPRDHHDWDEVKSFAQGV